MLRSRFKKLLDALKERIEKEGKKSPHWFLGFVEGLGYQKLTGYQIGALYHLVVLPDIDCTETYDSDTQIDVEQNDNHDEFDVSSIL